MMATSTLTHPTGPTPTPMQRIARALVLAQGKRLEYGAITVDEGFERFEFQADVESFPVRALVRVHHPRFYPAIAFGGTIGAGEAYMRGDWSTDDITNVVRLFVRNRELLDGMESGWAKIGTGLSKALHWLRPNTKSGSRRNIEAHYDLGNDFFAQFLDETMMYSAAVFDGPQATLFEASVAKMDRICGKLKLQPQDNLLEIGTGWGGFAIHAASKYGCRVTTTTISPKQHRWATERVKAAGLSDRVTVLLADYRDLTGQHDKLVSIEMIEAVGHSFLDAYFATCSRLLKPEGLMLLQAITIADQFYEQAKRSVDFIQRYIFPGGALPSIGSIRGSLARVTDMTPYHLEDFTPHYARTLQEWRRRFHQNIDQIRAQGFSDSFLRMWEFYLCYCEGGFLEDSIHSVQLLLTKPAGQPGTLQPQMA